MNDEYDEYDEDEQDQEPEQERSGKEWAALRRAQKEAKKAQREAEEAKRAMAFLKAGIDPDSPKAKYFVKGYEGDIDVEAIKAEALAAGIIEAPDAQVDLTPIDAQARIAEAAAGVGQSDMEIAVAQLDQAFAQGGTEGMLNHLQTLGIPINGETQ